MNNSAPIKRAAVLLAVIQFFFFATWVVYVIYLGDLLEQVGIGRKNLIWFVLMDQLVFSVTDTTMGFAADKVERFIGRLGPTIIAVNGVSCLAFLLMPFVASVQGGMMPAVFALLTVLWIGTSSVLRAPPIVLLMKHAAQPKVPRLAALSLLGLALGGALSPYIGIWLKGMDPRIPFVVTSLTLFIATIGLVWMQRMVARLPKPEPAAQAEVPRPGRTTIALLLAGGLLVGLGFQIHYFVNSKPQYLQFLDSADLMLVIPLFWVGFKLTAFPGSAAAARFGAIPVMTVAAVIGGVGLLGTGFAGTLGGLVTAQMITGGAWGVVFMAGISAALGLGRSGREGLILGLWFTTLSAAAVLRVAATLSGLSAGQVEFFKVLPGLSWIAGAGILIWLAWTNRRQLSARSI